MTGKKTPIISWIILGFFILITLFPIYILGVNSIKGDIEIKSDPIGFPKEIRLNNIVQAFTQGNFGLALLNSLKVSILVCLFVIPLAGIAAYALARLYVPGKLAWSIFFLFGMAVPAQLFLIPLFNNMSLLNLIDSHAGLVLIYVGIYLPFSIFFFRSFFLGLPKSIEESAMIDGCSIPQLIIRIIFPLSYPAIVSLVVILFTWVWNEFMFAVTFIHADELKTASTQYLAFSSSHDVDLAMVASAGIITTIPVILVFLLLQKSFIQGITQGSVK